MAEKKEIYNVGIYLRISKDDGDNIESESISNQRKIIMDFIKENEEMKIYDEYVDDGYSGTNFDRPGFKKLLEDIKNKKINIVITKNLARFGRNYIETGNYIEKIFPDYKVRYIAILDNIDSFKESVNNDFIPLKSVFNEKHCKDTSIAIKKTKRRRMYEGIYACNTAPFGYKKNPNNCGELIIDEESSKTVKKIFDLKIKGYTINEIVKYMDENKYLTPAEYMKIKGLENVKNKHIWRRSTVTRILGNKVYLGHCVRGKTQNISYKSKDKIYKKRKDFIIIKNTHEPIISEEIFKKVHNNKKYGLTREKIKGNYLLKDLIYCKECGKRLILKKVGDKSYLYCRRNEENYKLCSNDCKIEYRILEEKIMDNIIYMCKKYLKDGNNKDNLYKKYILMGAENIEEKFKGLKLSYEQLEFKIVSLYNQRLLGKITEQEYKEKYMILTKKRKELFDIIKIKESQIQKNKVDDIIKKEKVMKKFEQLGTIKYKNENLKELIERIEIFKKQINIKWNFIPFENV